MSLVYHRVTISSLHVDHAISLCADLRLRGVTFDTGYGIDGMNWELDWSIQGHMTAQDILLELEDLGINYTVTLIPDRRSGEEE
tara:strand:- start:894 stop:1145 length:252 start_codon:yes stop_codon:yes gene_type:complete